MGKIYAKLDSEGNIVSIKPHPGWLDDEGKLVDDEILLGFGYVPIVSEQLSVDEWKKVIRNPKEEWEKVYGTYKCKIYNEEDGVFEEIEKEGIFLIKETYTIEDITIDEGKKKLESLIFSVIGYMNKFYFVFKNDWFNSRENDLLYFSSLLELEKDSYLIRNFENNFVNFTFNELKMLVSSLKKFLLFKKWLKWSYIEIINGINFQDISEVRSFYEKIEEPYNLLKRLFLKGDREFLISDIKVKYYFDTDIIKIEKSDAIIEYSYDNTDFITLILSIMSEGEIW